MFHSYFFLPCSHHQYWYCMPDTWAHGQLQLHPDNVIAAVHASNLATTAAAAPRQCNNCSSCTQPAAAAHLRLQQNYNGPANSSKFTIQYKNCIYKCNHCSRACTQICAIAAHGSTVKNCNNLHQICFGLD